ncbi:MAG: family 16 glycoside hydrolase [Chthoniobacter sp.]
MLTTHFPLALALSLFAAAPLAAFDDDAFVRENGTALFVDDFNRHESTPDQEEIGNGWTTNSASRAQGAKQAALEDGALHVTKAAVADHGVAIFHDAAFQDGAVRLRFKLGEGDDLGVDFVDRELKTVHAGHLCNARVTLQSLTLTDSKTGGMDNAIRERRLAGDPSPELQTLLRNKSQSFTLDLQPGEWHTLLLVVDGDVMRATIDGKPTGEFRSPGIGHPTKRALTLAVNKSAWVDDVKVWKLQCDCEKACEIGPHSPRCHPERSVTESKDPVEQPAMIFGRATCNWTDAWVAWLASSNNQR